MAKCESMLFCGKLSRHPALETAAAKMELDLKGSKLAFSWGNLSLNKHVEEILFGKFHYEYVQYVLNSFIQISHHSRFLKLQKTKCSCSLLPFKCLWSGTKTCHEEKKEVLSHRKHKDQSYLGIITFPCLFIIYGHFLHNYCVFTVASSLS